MGGRATTRTRVGLFVGVTVFVALVVGLAFYLYPISRASTTFSGPSITTVKVVIPSGVGTDRSLNFEPPTITVVVGVNNTIMWVNQDSALHTATSISVSGGGPPFVSGTLTDGATFPVTLTGPGTYDYGCTFHPGWMKGKIIVKAQS